MVSYYDVPWYGNVMEYKTSATINASSSESLRMGMSESCYILLRYGLAGNWSKKQFGNSPITSFTYSATIYIYIYIYNPKFVYSNNIKRQHTIVQVKVLIIQ